MIIAIEGIDGAGKNTLATALSETAPVPLERLAFPRYKESMPAHLVQQALYGAMHDLTDSMAGMATLFALDRYGAKELLQRYEHSEEILLLDRYVASNAAYSVARSREPEIAQWIADLEINTLGLPRPTLQVLLDTTPNTASQRAQQREEQEADRQRDHYEKNEALQNRTAAAYAQLAQDNWLSPWLVIAEGESTQAASARIWQKIQEI